MKRILLSVLVMTALYGCATSSSTPVAMAPVGVHGGNICMTRTSLPQTVAFTVVGQVEGSKEFYGSVNEILPLMADEARKMGADAVMNLDTHQRIGLWAWARPVGTGTAVRLANKSDLNCAAVGGTMH
jgi:uncharacterized protein YbjQ (UPF0145 family)